MVPGGRLHGTAIAIWSGVSLIGYKQPDRTAPGEVFEERERTERLQRQMSTPVSKLLSVEIAATRDVNYSLLNNRRSIL
jgi:hypothetical protein